MSVPHDGCTAPEHKRHSNYATNCTGDSLSYMPFLAVKVAGVTKSTTASAGKTWPLQASAEESSLTDAIIGVGQP